MKLNAFWEVLFSVGLPLAIVVIIAALIMGADSIDLIVWGK